MFFKDIYAGPGRRSKLTGGMIILISILLVFQCFIIANALNMAIKVKVSVFWLDPYLQVEIEGADGYAAAQPVFDEASFRNDLENTLLSKYGSLSADEAGSLSEMTANAVQYSIDVKSADGSPLTIVNGSAAGNRETGESGGGKNAQNGDAPDDAQDNPANAADQIDLPLPGISNGNQVTVSADISDEICIQLREQGYYLAFECHPVTVTAEDLPEADPYDAFADLSVTFSGLDGSGEAAAYYNGYYPFDFSVEPSTGLRNGDTVHISISLHDEYDLNRIVEEYHIMPVSLSQDYTVSGLYSIPTGMDSFTQESRDALMEQGRLAAQQMLQEEYRDDERFTLDDAGMYFALSNHAPANRLNPDTTDNPDNPENPDAPENPDNASAYDIAETENYLFCLFRINYSNSSGEDFDYYYYVRFENLLLNDSGEVVADFGSFEYPHKPSIPIIGETLGDGAQVSVPGLLSFRSLAGYETQEQLISRVITPLETDFAISSLDNPGSENQESENQESENQ